MPEVQRFLGFVVVRTRETAEDRRKLLQNVIEKEQSAKSRILKAGNLYQDVSSSTGPQNDYSHYNTEVDNLRVMGLRERLSILGIPVRSGIYAPFKIPN